MNRTRCNIPFRAVLLDTTGNGFRVIDPCSDKGRRRRVEPFHILKRSCRAEPSAVYAAQQPSRNRNTSIDPGQNGVLTTAWFFRYCFGESKNELPRGLFMTFGRGISG